MYLGFLEFHDFLIMLVGFAVFMAIGRMHISAIFILGYLAYGFIFRFGRAPGYDRHFFRRLVGPTHRRPGHISPSFPYKETSSK